MFELSCLLGKFFTNREERDDFLLSSLHDSPKLGSDDRINDFTGMPGTKQREKTDPRNPAHLIRSSSDH